MFKQLVAVFLVSSLLTTLLLPAFIYADYLANTAEITAAFCENKSEPLLQCNGQCHLSKELKKVDQQSNEEEKAPPAFENFAFLWFHNNPSSQNNAFSASGIERNVYLSTKWECICIDQPGPPPQIRIA